MNIKEQILAQVIIDSYQKEKSGPPAMGVFTDIRKFQAIEAMGIFGKRQSMEFADFIGGYFHKRDGKWYPITGLQYPGYTTDELYECLEKLQNEKIKNLTPKDADYQITYFGTNKKMAYSIDDVGLALNTADSTYGLHRRELEDVIVDPDYFIMRVMRLADQREFSVDLTARQQSINFKSEKMPHSAFNEQKKPPAIVNIYLDRGLGMMVEFSDGTTKLLSIIN